MSKSDAAREVFEGAKGLLSAVKDAAVAMKEAAVEIAPGLANLPGDLIAEAGRQGTLGRSEIAAALFAGSAFTPYGEGQQSPDGGVHGPADKSPDKFADLLAGKNLSPAPDKGQDKDQGMER
jgi:hypothetical protein